MSLNPITEKTTTFLLDIRQNNNKKWFEANRKRYEQELLQPFKDLVTVLTPCIQKIDSAFEVKPGINKTISRIHRDMRFSKDKSPYKSTMWISFKIPSKDWKQTPVFFFEIMPPVYRYGMGFYMPEKSTMDQLRKHIDEERPETLSLIEHYNNQKKFILQGDDYKRQLNKTLAPEFANWYQKKNMFVGRTLEVNKQLYQDKLIKNIENGFEFLTPFYHYFWKLKG